jgi:type I restriction-modification system DNA methylase subunit
MAETKYKRDKKKQLGQFMTPRNLSKDCLKKRQYKITDKILEPSFGEGSFLIEIVYKLIDVYPTNLSIKEKIDLILTNNLYGVEMDPEMYAIGIKNIENEFSYKVSAHNFINDDFFNVEYDIKIKSMVRDITIR